MIADGCCGQESVSFKCTVSGGSTHRQWMAQYHECMNSANWTLWEIKIKLKDMKLEGVGWVLEELHEGVGVKMTKIY